MPSTVFTGKVIHRFESLTSTNEYAGQLLAKNTVMEGTVIQADHQSQGKGYSGNVWESVTGLNLLVSVILKPVFLQPRNQFFLNQAISLAVAETVKESVFDDHIKIKWPNDILFEDKKIAGILIENSIQKNRLQHTIIGIGLNVNQEKFSNDIKPATSLCLLAGKKFRLETVLDLLCENIEYRYLQLMNTRIQDLQKDYMKHLYKLEEAACFIANGNRFTGKIVGLTAAGKLILHIGDRHEVFGFKEVSFEFS